jgi:hypothetical protein
VVCLAQALVLALIEASFSDLLARFQVATSLKELGLLHPPAPSWHTSISKVVVKLNRPRGGDWECCCSVLARPQLHLQLLQDSSANGRLCLQCSTLVI